MRFNPTFSPRYEEGNAIKGIFDSAFGTLFLSNDDINKIYNISTDKTDNPRIFLALKYIIEGKEAIRYIKVMARVDDKSQKKFYLYEQKEVEHKEEVDVKNLEKTKNLQTIDYTYNIGSVKANLAIISHIGDNIVSVRIFPLKLTEIFFEF